MDRLIKSEKVNVKETLLANALVIPFGIFVVWYASTALNVVQEFQHEGFKTMAVIFAMFTTLKLLTWAIPSVHLITTTYGKTKK